MPTLQPAAALLLVLSPILLLMATPARADAEAPDAAAVTQPAAIAAPSAGAAAPAPTPAGEKPAAVDKPPAAVICKCPQAKPPLYVEDWGRLAALTQGDPEVFEKADFWRRREEATHWLLAGLFVGGTVATVATTNRLVTTTWTDTNKWALAGGIGLAVFSFLGYWAYSPDRDDLLTVINAWNLRHRDMLLAP
jgi:hypothetical protein